MGNVMSCYSREQLYGGSGKDAKPDANQQRVLLCSKAVACGGSLGISAAYALCQPLTPLSVALAAANVVTSVFIANQNGPPRYLALGTGLGMVYHEALALFLPPKLFACIIPPIAMVTPCWLLWPTVSKPVWEYINDPMTREIISAPDMTFTEELKILKQIIVWASPHTCLWVLTCLLQVASSLAWAVLPEAFTVYLESMAVADAQVLPASMKLLGIVLLTGAIDSVSNVVWFDAKVRTQMHIEGLMVANVVRQETAFQESTPAGEILSQMEAAGTLTYVVSGIIPNILHSLVTSITTFAMLWQHDLRLALLCVVPGFITAIPWVALARLYRNFREKNHAIISTSNDIVLETFSCAGAIQLLVAKNERLDQFCKCLGKQMKLVRMYHPFMAAAAFVENLLPDCTQFLLFLYATYMANLGLIPATSLVAVSMHQKTLVSELDGFMQYYVDWGGALGKAAQFIGLINRVPSQIPRGDFVPTKLHGGIVLRNVTFRYSPHTEPVLRNFNLTIQPGEFVALVGPSGGGKTTIINLIAGVYDPNEGEVCIDGVPVHEYDPKYLYTNALSVTSQEPNLFTGTFKENITMGLDDPAKLTPEWVQNAAKQAQAHEFIMASHKGYDTHIGTCGELLSGGQRQRVALARGFARDAAITILDEATSALDTENDNKIHAVVEKLAKNRTLLLVTHRLTTVVKADRIVVVIGGQAVQQGTHDELLAQDGPYRAMVQQSTGC